MKSSAVGPKSRRRISMTAASSIRFINRNRELSHDARFSPAQHSSGIRPGDGLYRFLSEPDHPDSARGGFLKNVYHGLGAILGNSQRTARLGVLSLEHRRLVDRGKHQ